MADLHVSKKSISKLFTEMQDRKFIIPDYQRPYKWDKEKCETLWKDIEEFSQSDAKNGADYFLGTIVSHKNNDKDLEIIDGQQRITSFFLLLRSFYKKLEDMPEDDDVIGLKTQIAPCLWDINPISQKITDRKKIHILSLVATSDDNSVFHNIVETGEANAERNDNYSLNYRYFKEQCDVYAANNPMQWKNLCVTILQKCIILPIECDTQDVALTIFSTLNDRGMPLADSDIFKAQLYRNTESEQKKKEFTEIWKDFTHVCKQGGLSLDDVFRYYTHVLRGRNSDKSKEVGLRKFYAENNYERIKVVGLMGEIMDLAYFWRYVNRDIEPENITYKLSIETRKYLQCLNCYPNEFWKYPTSVFFLNNKTSISFDQDFISLLKKLIAFLFAKFIEAPSVNAIKDEIYNVCINLSTSNKLQFKYEFDETTINREISNHSSSKLSRALLLLYAYTDLDQNDLIPDTFDIEHIFPKKWQDTNYNGWSLAEASSYLDRFGNKTVFEKKLNIQAGNGYFGVKKSRYSQSNISSVIKLSNYHKNDWLKEDIEERELDFMIKVIGFIESNLENN